MSRAPTRALAVTVRFISGRYHGEPEWPPSPARLFQALVAAAAAPSLDDEAQTALRWLEALPPPTIAAPVAAVGHARKTYVPNNDLDAKGGDPAAVASIRAGKITRPRIFDATTPVVYAWPLHDPSDEAPATAACQIALGIYQLGRGLDVAHASGSILTSAELDTLLESHPGELLRPNPGGPEGNGRVLECPCSGSFERLDVRYQANLERFGSEGHGRKRLATFRQPPKPLFARVAYNSQPARALFELRPSEDMARFAYTPATQIVALAERLRDGAASRLARAMPGSASDIERALVGRQVDGLPSIGIDARIRLIPLPSIGSRHADRGIRRLLVEVPSCAPLRAGDVWWAFSNLTCSNGQGSELRVTPTRDETMLEHYGLRHDAPVGEGQRVWRTVTPAALPLRSGRGSGPVGGEDRARAEKLARNAVLRALRHARVRTDVETVRVQREPFEAKGSSSEAFAAQTRFRADQLWHVEITFHRNATGPLVIGNGRFLGLGILAPVPPARRSKIASRVFAFEIVSGLHDAPALVAASALRRAVIARYQAAIGPRQAVPRLVSGHDDDGRPTERPHLSFVFDPDGARLLVVGPQWFPREELSTLRRALDGLVELRAGRAGRLKLRAVGLDDAADPLLAPARSWVSSTPYVVNRHIQAESAAEALRADLEAACRKLKLPQPRVSVLEARGVSGLGLTGRAELHFESAVPGPLLLGRTRHKGGGLFRHVEP